MKEFKLSCDFDFCHSLVVVACLVDDQVYLRCQKHRWNIDAETVMTLDEARKFLLVQEVMVS